MQSSKSAPKLHGLTPAQAAARRRQPPPGRLVRLSHAKRGLLNRVRPSEPICDTQIMRFGKRLIFPFFDQMTRAGVAVTPRTTRLVLKRARDQGVLLPSQYRLAKEHVLTLHHEWQRGQRGAAPFS